MQAGKLNQRVTIQQYSATRASNGEEVKSWSTVATVWASVEPLSGRELLAARDVRADVTTRIRIRYRTGITPKMRATMGSATYEISEVIDRSLQHRELELLCTAQAIGS